MLPDDLGGEWAFVEKGLVQTVERFAPPWTPDDVLQRLIDGKAALFVRADAFLVLEFDSEPISERRYLNVWIMWAEPQKAYPMRAQIVAWLRAMRLATGCEWVQFSSPRDGWFGIDAGFLPVMTIWRLSE